MTLTLEHDVKTEKWGQRETVWVMYIEEGIFLQVIAQNTIIWIINHGHSTISRLQYIFPFHNPYDLTHCPVNTSMSFCIHSFVFLEFPYHQAKKASAKSAFYLAVVGFNGIGFTSNKIYKLTDSVCQSIMTALTEMGLNIWTFINAFHCVTFLLLQVHGLNLFLIKAKAEQVSIGSSSELTGGSWCWRGLLFNCILFEVIRSVTVYIAIIITRVVNG